MYGKVCVLLTAAAMTLGGAGDAALDRATLRGLKGIHVVLDPVAPELEKEGASADALRGYLEKRLREGGVPIDAASTEFVALRLTSVRAARGPFAVAMIIGLYQPVSLVREPKIKTATQTWEVDTVVLAEPKQVYQACMDSVDDLAGRFATAYHSMNKTTP